MFLFGAATSSHQVEGGNHNNWSEWEEKTAEGRAESAKQREWPDYLLSGYPSPRKKENYISGIAADHYHRYEEDFDIAQSLGHTAHRFSIEWSRIEPKEGKFDEQEIDHYRNVIKALHARGMEPFVTLWHWTIPVWFAEKGGWESSECVHYFSRYVKKIITDLGDDVHFWITLNEPEVNTSISYILGNWPPQKKSISAYLRVLLNLVRGHKSAYRIIKKQYPDAEVGIAKHNTDFEAADNKTVNRFLKFLGDWWWNSYFLDRIADYQDFIGLNHYFHNLVDYGFEKNKKKIVSDMGWEIHPKSIYVVLKDLAKYEKPIYIMENGVADARDVYRESFIRETLEWVKKAKREGVDVRGYLYWSLLDNFEWADGFWPRFGLVAVDYKTMERHIRPSAYAYKKMIEEWKEKS